MMLETDDFLMEALFGVFRVGLAKRVVALAFFFLNIQKIDIYTCDKAQKSIYDNSSTEPPTYIWKISGLEGQISFMNYRTMVQGDNGGRAPWLV